MGQFAGHGVAARAGCGGRRQGPVEDTRDAVDPRAGLRDLREGALVPRQCGVQDSVPLA